jgi:glycosyltransferase involved in cell wall biosynthesis
MGAPEKLRVRSFQLLVAMNYAAPPASILCVGVGWFPKTPGGLNRYVYELTQQLSISGDHIQLCGVDLPQTSALSTVQLTNLASPDCQFLKRLWHFRSNFPHHLLRNVNAINLHFALYSFPILQQLPKDIPITFSFHGPWALESYWEGHSKWNVAFKQWLEQRVYQRCDRFIVLSKAFGKILNETYHIPWEKIHIIPGGVNTTRFQPNLTRQEARQKLGWHSDRKILFTSRRLVNRMGLDKLLTAMVQVKQRVPEVWLAIAGKGPQRESLEQQSRELGLENQVKFLGFLPDEQLPIAYQASDLTVVPSQSLEGFGLILVESLACGTPAFCTPIGGMPEIISPFYPELISHSSEADDIARHLIQLLNGEILLPTRTECREYALQRFDWQNIASRVREVLLA